MLIDEILDYLIIATDGLRNLSIFIILIVVAVYYKKKDLEPDCEKGFSKSFIKFLLFSMFSTFFYFTYSIINKIVWEIQITDPLNDFYFDVMSIVWMVTYGLAFLSQFIAFLMLFGSMEIKLFYKKSEGKFGKLSFNLLISGLLLVFIEILMYLLRFPPGYYGLTKGGFVYTGQLSSEIYRFVVVILTNFIYLIIGIKAYGFLIKTAENNNELRVYTKNLSVGVIFLYIILPLLNQLAGILTFIGFMSRNFDFRSILMSIKIIGIFSLSCIIFIIGIINIAKGAIKTMDVPLTFSRDIYNRDL